MRTISECIDSLYEAFRDVPKPRKIDGCPCCVGKKNISILLSKPLRAISADELASYTSSAFLTVGDKADYGYFLPRILEVACGSDAAWLDIEIIGRAIRQCEPGGWSEKRMEAFSDLLRAVIQRAVDRADGSEIDRWICAIAKMGFSPRSYLEQIERSPNAILDFYECNSEALQLKRKLGNAFWGEGDAGYNEVMAWFTSPEMTQTIFTAYGLPLKNGYQ